MRYGTQLIFTIVLFVILSVFVYTCFIEPRIISIERKAYKLKKLFAPQYKVFPYRVKKNFLTANEYKFLFVLGQYAGTSAYICPMVGLKDILIVDKNNNSDYQRHLNKIQRKNVDFVLVSPDQETRILCAIELVDSSHNTKNAKEKDEFKDYIIYNAGLPLIRVRHGNYSVMIILTGRLG